MYNRAAKLITKFKNLQSVLDFFKDEETGKHGTLNNVGLAFLHVLAVEVLQLIPLAEVISMAK